MENPTERGKTLFTESLEAIERVIDFTAARHRLDRDTREDFRSYVMVKLIEDDYRRIRDYRGESQLATYLFVVVQRLFLDFCAQSWGTWRPSSRARALGEPALLLERLIHRDGLPRTEARQALERHGYYLEPHAFDELLNEIPYRPRRRYVSAAVLEGLPDARGRLSAGERALLGERFAEAFATAARNLNAEDRLLLKLRFVDGCAVRAIAHALHLRERPLYARLARLLRRLRKALEKDGFDRTAARTLWVERVEVDVESALRVPSGSVGL